MEVIFCQYKSYSASISDILPIGVRSYILQSCSVEIICSLTVSFDILFCSAVLLCSADSIYPFNTQLPKVSTGQSPTSSIFARKCGRSVYIHKKLCKLELFLRACFADINVSQGSVATHARCGEILISI